MKKKFFAAIASVMMLGTILAMPVSAAETYQKGDVNMDGKVDLADAQIVQLEYLHYFTGYECTFNEEQMKLATIVGHSTKHPKKTESIPFSVADAQVILQYYTYKDVLNTIDDSVTVEEFYAQIKEYTSK